jgi:hypothetical protein
MEWIAGAARRASSAADPQSSGIHKLRGYHELAKARCGKLRGALGSGSSAAAGWRGLGTASRWPRTTGGRASPPLPGLVRCGRSELGRSPAAGTVACSQEAVPPAIQRARIPRIAKTRRPPLRRASRLANFALPPLPHAPPCTPRRPCHPLPLQHTPRPSAGSRGARLRR